MMSNRVAIALFDGLLLIAAAWFAWYGRTALSISILAAAGSVIFLQSIYLGVLRGTGSTVRIECSLKPTHYVQAVLQSCLYVYWGLYWNEVAAHVPLVLVQIVFAYAFEMLLSWIRYGGWRMGLGPFPIVLSLNLFLWFREEYFLLQLLLIVLTYLLKETVHWRRADRAGHIFNPSAGSLAIVSIALLVAGRFDVSRGVDIVETFTLPPNMLEVIFLLGLVVQTLYRTTLVSFGAVLSQCLFFGLSYAYLGYPISPTPINISVFLALTLLVTDPSTSPRTPLGKFLFGIIYGLGTYVICVALRLTQEPSFIDKIVMVPVVNLLVPTFDRVGARFHTWVEQSSITSTPRLWRAGWILTYSAVFVAVLPALKTPLPKPDELPFPPPAIGSSPSVTRVLGNMEYARRVLPGPYKPLGFRSEFEHYPQLKQIYEEGFR